MIISNVVGALDFKIEKRISPAKVNLWLRVGAKRKDGYHEVETFILPVKWGDEISATIRQASQTSIYIEGDTQGIPTKSNLITKAAELFSRKIPVFFEARFRIKKVIPQGAGLGGGSSNAAQTLTILKEWYLKNIGEGLHRKSGGLDKKIHRMAADLGADVPLFLNSRPVWCTGKGEKLEEVSWKKAWPIVIAYDPQVSMSTPEAYQLLSKSRKSDASSIRLTGRPYWLKQAKDQVPGLHNDFQSVVLDKKPQLKRVLQCLTQAGALNVKMSGSGAAFFGLFESPQRAKKAARAVREGGFVAIETQGLCS